MLSYDELTESELDIIHVLNKYGPKTFFELVDETRLSTDELTKSLRRLIVEDFVNRRLEAFELTSRGANFAADEGLV